MTDQSAAKYVCTHGRPVEWRWLRWRHTDDKSHCGGWVKAASDEDDQ